MHLLRRLGVLAPALVALAVATLAGASASPASANPELLVDMNTGEVLYASEAGVPWHPASLTKLMTAYVAFEAIEAGQVGLATKVVMSANAAKEPPAKVGLPVGTAVTLDDALYLLLVKSANDMAVAIAETIGGSEGAFVDEMNRAAVTLGLTATHYDNPNGLDDPAQVTSARDLAVLALTIRARFPQYDRIFQTDEVLLGRTRLDSENNLLTEFAGTTGMKTGFICEAGLNIVATAERDGKELMAVILGSASSRERGQRAAELLTRGFNGDFPGTGQPVSTLTDHPEIAPVNMRPEICGKQAAEYRAQHKADYPYGLEGQPSFLDARVPPRIHQMLALGRFADVPLPRPRPNGSAAAPRFADVIQLFPTPRPRPQTDP